MVDEGDAAQTQFSAETAYLFRHALVREGAYQLQLPTERSSLHVLALDILEQVLAETDAKLLKVHAAELADHAFAAQEGAAAEVRSKLCERELGHLRQAAIYAAGNWRHAEVVNIARRVEELKCATLRDLSVATCLQVSSAITLGKYAAARDKIDAALDASKRAGDRRGQFVTLFNACLIAQALGDQEEEGRRSEQLLNETADEPASLDRARALKARAYFLAEGEDNATAFEYLSEAVKILEDLSEERELAGVLINRGLVLHGLDRSSDAQRDTARAKEISIRHGDHMRLGLIYLEEAEKHIGRDEFHEAIAAAAKAAEQAVLADASLQRARALHAKAIAQQGLGDETAAHSSLRQAVELVQDDATGPKTITIFIRYADSLLRRGQREEAKQIFSRAQALEHHVPKAREIQAVFKNLKRSLSQ